MSEQDLRSESQKYLDEMMRFYTMNKNASVSGAAPETPADSGTAPPKEDDSDGEFDSISGEPFEDISDEEINEERPEAPPAEKGDENISGKEVSFESRFPVPVIPDFMRRPAPVPEPGPPRKSPEEYAGQGYLKIEVRTGENGLPVPGAAVTVSEKNANGENIIFTGVSDQSGSVPKLKLPAPLNQKGSSPESFQNYSVYTVSVFAKDFFREVSADVPVFAGVTSIQRFNLIPMPFNYDDEGQSIITENTEPEI